MLLALRSAWAESSLNRVAIGHFNVSEIVALRASVSAAHQLGVPVLIGVSEGGGTSSEFIRLLRS